MMYKLLSILFALVALMVIMADMDGGLAAFVAVKIMGCAILWLAAKIYDKAEDKEEL